MIDNARESTSEALVTRVAELEIALAQERRRADEASAERDRLREGFHHLQLEVELLRRRLVVAKAERVDTTQLQLEFATKLRELDRLAGLTPDDATDGTTEPELGPRTDPSGKKKKKRKSKGRRRLSELDVPEERVELTDPALEDTATRIGTEDSYKLMWRRAGYVRLVVARASTRLATVMPRRSRPPKYRVS